MADNYKVTEGDGTASVFQAKDNAGIKVPSHIPATPNGTAAINNGQLLATDAVLQAVRDRLPTTLNVDGSLKASIQSAIESAVTAINGKLPTSLAADRTTATAPFATRLSDGTNFLTALPVTQSGSWNVGVTGTPSVTQSGSWNVGITGNPAVAQSGAWSVGITGNPAVAQFGTWNVGITGAVPLPTGASSSSLQTSGNTSLASIDGKLPTLGQALSAASVPVVLPAAQLTALTPPATVTANLGTIAGIATESTLSAINGKIPASPATDRTSAAAPFAMRLSDGTNFLSALPVTQSGSWLVGLTGNPAVAQFGAWNVGITGTPAVAQSGSWSVGITGTPTVAQSGAWDVGITGNPAVAQFGTWNVGITGNPSVAQSGVWNVGITGTPAVAQSGSWSVGVTGALPLPTGAATATLQSTLNTSVSSVDAKIPAQINDTLPVRSVRDLQTTTINPTVSTSAHTSGVVFFAPVSITAAQANGRKVIIRSITAIDTANQSKAFDILIFNDAITTQGSINTAWAATVADMLKIAGIVQVFQASYIAFGTSYAIASNLVDMEIDCNPVSGSQNIFIAGRFRDSSGTYAANSLQLIITWERL